MQIATLRLGNQTVAIELTFTREVVELQKLSRLFHASKFIIGVKNIRGEAVPIITLLPLLCPNSIHSCIRPEQIYEVALILEVKREKVGLAGQRPVEILTLNPSSVYPLQPGTMNSLASFSPKLISVDKGKTGILIDPEKLCESLDFTCGFRQEK